MARTLLTYGVRRFISPRDVFPGDLIEFTYTKRDGSSSDRVGVVISKDFEIFPNSFVFGVIETVGLSDLEIVSLINKPEYSRRYYKKFKSFNREYTKRIRKVFVDVGYKFSFQELDQMAIQRWQWKANRAENETVGARYIIVPITEEIAVTYTTPTNNLINDVDRGFVGFEYSGGRLKFVNSSTNIASLKPFSENEEDVILIGHWNDSSAIEQSRKTFNDPEEKFRSSVTKGLGIYGE